MARQVGETIFGAFVLVLALGFGFYAFQRADISAGASQSRYMLEADFASAEGVRKGSEIRMAGVAIGQVTDLWLDTERLVAKTRFAIDSSVLIPDDSVATIASEGLLGGHFVEIIPGGSFENLADSDQIAYTQGAVSLLTLLTRFAASAGASPDNQ